MQQKPITAINNKKYTTNSSNKHIPREQNQTTRAKTYTVIRNESPKLRENTHTNTEKN